MRIIDTRHATDFETPQQFANDDLNAVMVNESRQRRAEFSVRQELFDGCGRNTGVCEQSRMTLNCCPESLIATDLDAQSRTPGCNDDR